MPKIFDFFKNETCILFHKHSDDGNKAANEVIEAFECGFDFAFGDNKGDARCYDRETFERSFVQRLSHWVAEKHQATVINA